MKLAIVLSMLVLSPLPAAADQSLLDMLRQPASPALAAVLADDAPATGDLDAAATPRPADARITRGIATQPVTVTTIAVKPGREISLPSYVNRE